MLLQGEELRFQLQMTDELQNTKNKLQDENLRLKREVVLYAEKEHEYAKRGHRQGKEIRELTEVCLTQMNCPWLCS